MKSDAHYLTLHALQTQDRPTGEQFAIDIVCRSLIQRRRDRDGLIAGLKWALDSIAKVLDVDDSEFSFGSVEFEKGQVEETELVISGA